MTLDELVAATMVREGPYAEPPTIDQPTAYGITAAALAEDRAIPISQVTSADLKALTEPQAAGVIKRRLQRALSVVGLDRIAYEPLRIELLDYGFNSGNARAIRWLQRTVLLPPAFVTGRIDDRTLLALSRLPPVLVTNALAAERAHAAFHGGAGGEQLAVGVARRAIAFTVRLDAPLPDGSVETTQTT